MASPHVVFRDEKVVSMRQFRRREEALAAARSKDLPDTYSYAIPAMQEEAPALIAGLVFAAEG